MKKSPERGFPRLDISEGTIWLKSFHEAAPEAPPRKKAQQQQLFLLLQLLSPQIKKITTMATMIQMIQSLSQPKHLQKSMPYTPSRFKNFMFSPQQQISFEPHPQSLLQLQQSPQKNNNKNKIINQRTESLPLNKFFKFMFILFTPS